MFGYNSHLCCSHWIVRLLPYRSVLVRLFSILSPVRLGIGGRCGAD